MVLLLLITDYLAFKLFWSLSFFSISSLGILFNLILFIRFDPSTFNCSIYVSCTFLEFFSCNLIPLLLLSIESDKPKRHMCDGVCLAHRQQPKRHMCAGVCPTRRHDSQASGIRSPVGTPPAWRLDPARCSLTTCLHQTVQSTVKKHSQFTVYTLQYKIVQFIVNSLQ